MRDAESLEETFYYLSHEFTSAVRKNGGRYRHAGDDFTKERRGHSLGSLVTNRQQLQIALLGWLHNGEDVLEPSLATTVLSFWQRSH